MQLLKTCKRKTDDDEFYTFYKDVVRELHKYDLRGYKIICPCDNDDSTIYQYLKHCYYNVEKHNSGKDVDYSKYDIVITNPPFSQVREFIRYLVNIKKHFILIVSDVLRYSLKNNKLDFGIIIYKGKDAQRFYRPDGLIRGIHCGGISDIQDSGQENKNIRS